MLKEPLLHFLLLGALLFGLNALFSPGAPREIVVTDAIRAELIARLEREGATPSQADVEAAEERWVEQEILYREGMARGFEHDPVVRARVARKMMLVLEAQAIVPEPTEAELDAWYGENAERYADVARIDFTHVFVNGSDEASHTRAQELLAQLKSGASPNGLGDTFSGGRRYRRRAAADLEATFGEEFIGLDQQPLGEWVLRRSRYGFHVVRIDQRTPALNPDPERAREDVKKDWTEESRRRAVAKELARLRAAWVVK